LSYRYICNKCKKKFKYEYDLESHIDIHTPYFYRNVIKLSGADQIRLLLKKWHGGWNKAIKDEEKRVKEKGDYDLQKYIKLKDFEKENNIQFVICGDKVESYRCLNQ